MSRDIDDLRHPERCPTSARLEVCATCYLTIGIYEPRIHLHGAVHHAQCGGNLTPATDSLPVEEERMFHAAWCHENEAEGERLMRGRISSLTEEVERLRERAVNAERILLSDDYTVEAVATIEADRDEWKARAEWLAGQLGNSQRLPHLVQAHDLARGKTAAWLVASLEAVKEDK